MERRKRKARQNERQYHADLYSLFSQSQIFPSQFRMVFLGEFVTAVKKRANHLILINSMWKIFFFFFLSSSPLIIKQKSQANFFHLLWHFSLSHPSPKPRKSLSPQWTSDSRIQTHERLKRTLFSRTKNNMRIFAVISLSSHKRKRVKRWNMSCRLGTCFCWHLLLLVSSAWFCPDKQRSLELFVFGSCFRTPAVILLWYFFISLTTGLWCGTGFGCILLYVQNNDCVVLYVQNNDCVVLYVQNNDCVVLYV